MATVTLDTLVERLAGQTGFYVKGLATGGSTTTIVDSVIQNFDSEDTKKIIGKWANIYFDAGAAAGAPENEDRKINAVTTTEITVDHAYSAAVVATDGYEIMRFRRRTYVEAIQQALRESWPTLYQPLRNETLVVDELLSNGLAETFTSADVPDNWAEVGTPTTTEENTRVFQGTSSIKSVPSAADEGYSQTLFTSVNVRDVAGRSMTFWANGWSDGAAGMKVRISFDLGSTYSDGDTHSGSSEWERLRIEATVPTTATSITVYLWNGTSDTLTVYWDFMHAHVDPISQYTIPAAFILAPNRIAVQDRAGDPTGYYVPLTAHNRPEPGAILRLEGKGRLSVPTTGLGTTEIDDAVAEFVVALSARIMFNKLMSSDPTQRGQHEEDRNWWGDEAARLSLLPGIRARRMAASKPQLGSYRFGSDSSGNYLELPR